jgi:SNF2 family DNA or RNA helicase
LDNLHSYHALFYFFFCSGKTIQSTAFLRQLQTNPSTNVRGPFLIVAPLSLVGQWQSELATWAPDMNVVLYHGSADARNFLVNHEFYYNEPFVQKSTATKLKKQGITKFHVLITTYEVCLKDASVLSKIKWRVLLVGMCFFPSTCVAFDLDFVFSPKLMRFRRSTPSQKH